MSGPAGVPAGRRFWREVAVAAVAEGFRVTLDERPLRSPAKAPCVLPGRALAEALAAEWAAVKERVDPAAMPVTRAAMTAIDRVAPQAAAVRDELAAYGGSDLLCYRASHPAALAVRQAAAWDPVLDWAAARFAARLATTAGVMHRGQPAPALAALAAALEGFDAWELTAMHELVTLSGSLLLGLAVAEGRLAPDAAWTASRIDEDWQAEQWGEDAQAAAAAAARRAAFAAAARFLDLVRAG